MGSAGFDAADGTSVGMDTDPGTDGSDEAGTESPEALLGCDFRRGVGNAL